MKKSRNRNPIKHKRRRKMKTKKQKKLDPKKKGMSKHKTMMTNLYMNRNQCTFQISKMNTKTQHIMKWWQQYIKTTRKEQEEITITK